MWKREKIRANIQFEKMVKKTRRVGWKGGIGEQSERTER